MTDPKVEEAFGMARASVSAFLSGNGEALQQILDHEEYDAEQLSACAHVLVGMLAGAVSTRAMEIDADPLDYWSKVIARSMGVVGH